MELIITIPEKSLPLIDAVRLTETGDRGELEDWIRAQVEALLNVATVLTGALSVTEDLIS